MQRIFKTQLRLYDGLVDTRFLLLKLRPNLRAKLDWAGFGIPPQWKPRRGLESVRAIRALLESMWRDSCVVVCASLLISHF